MTFGQRMKQRRTELGMTRAELAEKLHVTLSAVSNYETGISFPKAEIFLRLFDCLETEPNDLLRDSFRGGRTALNAEERRLVARYRKLSGTGRETVQSLTDSLCAFQEELEADQPREAVRQIPLYHSPAAAGYTAPVFGEDFDYIPVTGQVPQGAEYAVRIQGDSMSPWIEDGSTAYVNRDPLRPGDVGIFCVDGEMFCKQYYRDPAGVVYLFSLNRARSDADITLMPSGGRMLVCLGRVILRRVPPLPGKDTDSRW